MFNHVPNLQVALLIDTDRKGESHFQACIFYSINLADNAVIIIWINVLPRKAFRSDPRNYDCINNYINMMVVYLQNNPTVQSNRHSNYTLAK